MRLPLGPSIAALLTIGSCALPLQGQSGNSAEIQKKLLSEFSLTKVTADRSDIVTAGSVLVLHKDGLVMYSSPTETSPLNIYKDGQIQFNPGSNVKQLGLKWLKARSMPTSNVPQRKFVAGEKFWVTAIDVEADGVVFNVYSDPYNDVRYYGQLKFPFAKNSPPATDEMVKNVEEVVTVQPADNASGNGDAGNGSSGQAQNGPAPAASSQAPAVPAAAMAPIAPPPPPPDQPAPPPKTISVGQTKAVVLATWGQPGKDITIDIAVGQTIDQVTSALGAPVAIVDLGAKKIYKYKDMKITFNQGKVTDVQ